MHTQKPHTSVTVASSLSRSRISREYLRQRNHPSRVALHKHTNTYHGDEPSRYAGRVLPTLYQHTPFTSVNTQTHTHTNIIAINHRSITKSANPSSSSSSSHIIYARTREPVIRRGTARGGIHLLRVVLRVLRGDGRGENASLREHDDDDESVVVCENGASHRSVRARTPIHDARHRSIESRARESRDSRYDRSGARAIGDRGGVTCVVERLNQPCMECIIRYI